MQQPIYDSQDLDRQAYELVLQTASEHGAADIDPLPDRDNSMQIYSDQERRHYHVRVRGGREGAWQISVEEGRAPDEAVNDNEFWALVDLSSQGDAGSVFIVPGQWLRRKVHADHQVSLMEQPESETDPAETRLYPILVQEVQEWKEGWEQMGL
jgi:hypothetical protein